MRSVSTRQRAPFPVSAPIPHRCRLWRRWSVTVLGTTHVASPDVGRHPVLGVARSTTVGSSNAPGTRRCRCRQRHLWVEVAGLSRLGTLSDHACPATPASTPKCQYLLSFSLGQAKASTPAIVSTPPREHDAEHLSRTVRLGTFAHTAGRGRTAPTRPRTNSAGRARTQTSPIG